MSELRRPLREVLRDTTPDTAEVERLWQGLQARRAPPRRWPWLAAPALAAALALLLLWPARDGGRGPLTLADGAPLAQVEAEAPHALAFRDGSRVELEAGASLRPLGSAGREVDLELRRGRARFTLAPGRRWSVDAGGVIAQASGARFAVWRGRDGVDVVVSDGEVTLRGERVPGLLRRLGAGASLHVAAAVTSQPAEAPAEASAKGPEAAAQRSVPAPEGPAAATAGTPSGAVASSPSPGPGPVPGVVATAPGSPAAPSGPAPVATVMSRPVTREAPRAVPRTTEEAAPPAPPTPQAATPAPPPILDELLRQADAARLRGRPAEALPLLERAAREFPGDRRAAVAAFTRGRIFADELRRPAAAAEAFAQAIALGLPDALAETAYLRLVESRKAAGDGGGARAAAAEHRARYPRGRAAAQIERVLGAP